MESAEEASLVPVRSVRASWTASPSRPEGGFEIAVTTDDDDHLIEVAAAAMPGLLGMIAASPEVLWHPVTRSLVSGELLRPSQSQVIRQLSYGLRTVDLTQ